MSQMGQAGHNEMTMISNPNMSKSQYSNNTGSGPGVPNLKRPVFDDDDQ